MTIKCEDYIQSIEMNGKECIVKVSDIGDISKKEYLKLPDWFKKIMDGKFEGDGKIKIPYNLATTIYKKMKLNKELSNKWE